MNKQYLTYAVVQILTSSVRFPTGRALIQSTTLSAKYRPCFRFNSVWCLGVEAGGPGPSWKRLGLAGKRKLEFAKWQGAPWNTAVRTRSWSESLDSVR